MGQLAALGGALVWAIGSVLLTHVSRRLHLMTLGTVRYISATLFFVLLLPITGQWRDFASLNFDIVIAVLASIILVLGIGDTLFFYAARQIGLVRVMPLSMTYPLFTFVLAALFLGETVSVLVVAGAVAILGGVYLLSSGPRAAQTTTAGESHTLGVALALLAALCWATGSVILTPQTREIGTVALNTLRQAGAAVLLFALMPKQSARGQLRALRRRDWLALVGGGVIGGGFGALFYVWALSLAGASIASVLTAASPVFSTPLSVLLLGEKVNLRLLAGTALSMLGIWLVILG